MIGRLLINAAALTAAAFLVPGIVVSGPSTWHMVGTIAVIAVIFGILNALVKPLLTLISTPVVIVTLGLFLIVINMVMLRLTSWVAGLWNLQFHVDGWGAAFWGSLVVSLVSMVLGGLFTRKHDRD